MQILRASDVPESKVALLPDPIDGTIGEARQIRRLVDAPGSERVVVDAADNQKRQVA